jgi:hypothetical protein
MSESPETRTRTTAELIADGRDALLAGEKARAQALLQMAVRDEPDNVEAWLWLSGTHSRPEEMAYCLHQVLEREPDHPQALEGLAWLAEKYPPAEPVPTMYEPSFEQPAPERAAHAPMAARQARVAPATSSLDLFEAGLHAAAFGALLGLLRLTTTLRPGTLLLVRGSEGSVGWGAALGLAATAALLHALAMLAAWSVLGLGIAQVRNDRPGDRYDSLVRAGVIVLPGYLTAVTLLIAAAGLGWGERRWIVLVFVVWALLIVTGIAVVRRFVASLDALRVSRSRRGAQVARITVPALIVALITHGLAGLAVQALLKAV